MPSVFYQKILPQEKVSAEQYREFLERGWYRVQQILMTTDFIMMDGMPRRKESMEDFQGYFQYQGKEVGPVFWLRINLNQLAKPKRHPFQKYIETNFRIEVKPFEYQPAYEELYAKYLNGIEFDASPTLFDYIFDVEGGDYFNSTSINLYHNDQLIAFGIFDEADTCSAGIINCFDPSYKKYSLGKWLIHKKINLSIQKKHTFYYPGYFSTRIPKFDYKLQIEPNATEVWIREAQQWIPFEPSLMTKLENYLIGIY